MFDAARRRLTLWNVVIIVLVLAVFGAGVYFWTARRLVGEVDAALARLAGQLVREVEDHEDHWLANRPGAEQSPEEREEDPEDREEPEDREGSDDGAERLRGILRREEPGRPHAALLVGTAVAWRSPEAPAGFPSPELAREARRRQRPVVATLVFDGRPWRVRAAPLPPDRDDHGGRRDGRGGGRSGTGAGADLEELPVVQVALPLAGVQDSLAALLRVLFLAGVGGVGLAAVAGYAQAWRALRPIREAMERQRLFTAGASHEMRTPLAVIRAHAELLEGELRDPDQRQLARGIVEEAERLARLVDDLLTLARGEGPEPVIEPRLCDLAALVGEAVRAAQPLAAAREVALAYEVGERGEAGAPGVSRGRPGGVAALVDPDRIRQLVLILLSNAIRYTDPGTTVTVRLLPAAGPRGDHRLIVEDEGPGIPPADLERIFEPFYRGDAARSRATGGFGLGLAVARWIVERHGGRIRAANRQPRGARFEVELPARAG
ncbi:MAG TPA: HAMP domain-containing sensor histidine kinase [Thermaerobacter sp.]